MSPKTPRLKASKVFNILQRHGFIFVSQRGSHQKWRNNNTHKQVIVPIHKGKELPLGNYPSSVGRGVVVIYILATALSAVFTIINR